MKKDVYDAIFKARNKIENEKREAEKEIEFYEKQKETYKESLFITRQLKILIANREGFVSGCYRAIRELEKALEDIE